MLLGARALLQRAMSNRFDDLHRGLVRCRHESTRGTASGLSNADL